MKEVIKVLEGTKYGFLATIDAGKPRVRPFEFQFLAEGKYYFCTGKSKPVANQIKKTPTIEFCAVDEQMKTVRIRGEAKFSDEIAKKERILKHNDLVRSIFQRADNQEFEIFYLDHGKAIIFDLLGNLPREIEF